jgi:hypothetical protein
MAKVDKAKLIKNRPRVDDGVVSVPEVGDFRIRPLTRAETLKVHDAADKGGKAAAEAMLLHLSLTDPTFTLEEVEQWMAERGSSREIQPISQAVGVISGLSSDAGKQAYKSAG